MKSGKIYVTAAIGAGIVCIAAMLGVLSAAIYAEDEKNDSFLGLMYHQVLKDESRAGKYIITPYELEEDLKYLSQNGYVSILPSELEQINDGKKKLPEKAVMITFDDGYETGHKYCRSLYGRIFPYRRRGKALVLCLPDMERDKEAVRQRLCRDRQSHL